MEPRSVRLNASNRAVFIRDVLEDTMPFTNQPTIDDFKKSKRDVIYDLVYGEIKDQIDALPKWATVSIRKVWVKLGSEDVSFPVDPKKGYRAFETGEGSWGHNDELPIRRFDTHHPLTKEYVAFVVKIRDWVLRRTKLEQELRKVVEACNTSAQLYAAWPKAVEYAHCFPYTGKDTRKTKPKVDSSVLDVTLKITASDVELPKEN